MDLSEIRKLKREQRRAVAKGMRAAASRQICDTIALLSDFREANKVAAFLPFDGEVDLSQLLALAFEQEKQLFLPIVLGKGRTLKFARYTTSTKLVEDRFGILKPDVPSGQLIEANELECVLTPLVAFDSGCHRIGVGGGFYDRTFAFKRSTTNRSQPNMIGVAFELQKVDAIQPEPWDVCLDAVVTEAKVYQRDDSNSDDSTE